MLTFPVEGRAIILTDITSRHPPLRQCIYTSRKRLFCAKSSKVSRALDSYHLNNPYTLFRTLLVSRKTIHALLCSIFKVQVHVLKLRFEESLEMRSVFKHKLRIISANVPFPLNYANSFSFHSLSTCSEC